MADLFRKSSIERLSDPEQLDKAITVSSSMSWLALAGVSVIIAVTLIWSFFGTLPTMTDVSGIIVDPVSVCAVCSGQSGTVSEMLVKEGDEIRPGTEIARIELSDGSFETVKADYAGTVSVIAVSAAKNGDNGTPVFPGSEIIRYTPDINEKQTVVCYVPLTVSKQLKKGMEVLVFPSSADINRYGHINAVVENIGEYPVSVQSTEYVLGPRDNGLAERFLSGGPAVAVVCRPIADPSSKSGFEWSSKNGADVVISNGTAADVKIVVENSAPITKLITGLKEKLEG